MAESEGTCDRILGGLKDLFLPPRTASPMPRGCDTRGVVVSVRSAEADFLALLRSSIAMARSI